MVFISLVSNRRKEFKMGMKKDKREPIVHSISLDDLDGYGCQFVIGKSYEHTSFKNVSYGGPDKTKTYIEIALDEVSEEISPNDTLFITGVRLIQKEVDKVIEMANSGVSVIYIKCEIKEELKDDLTNANVTVIENNKKSASLLTYEYCKPETLSRNIIERINAYETFDKSSEYIFKDGKVLSELLHDVNNARLNYLSPDDKRAAIMDMLDTYDGILAKALYGKERDNYDVLERFSNMIKKALGL
jgi:oligoribonuclease NrnB/cAMP/cGMP phosphodiesterase (DHH superfamily)